MAPLAFRPAWRPAVVILTWLILCGAARAVITFERRYNYPHIDLYPGGCGAVLPDAGFVLSGGGSDALPRGLAELVRIDSVGDVVWFRLYGPPYPYDAFAHRVCWTLDGCYVFCGDWTGPDTSYAFVAKADTLGNLLWIFFYDGMDNNFSGVCATHDSGCVLTGSTGLSSGKIGIHLLKLNRDGEVEWWKVCPDSLEAGFSVQQTRDLGYIIGGRAPIQSDRTNVSPVWRKSTLPVIPHG